MLFVGKWMELGIVMLNKISQDGKDGNHVFSLHTPMNKKVNVGLFRGEMQEGERGRE
jgi:hypothetical protein